MLRVPQPSVRTRQVGRMRGVVITLLAAACMPAAASLRGEPSLVVTKYDTHSLPHYKRIQPSPLDQWVAFPGISNETATVLSVIGRSQNPPDCESRQYLIWVLNQFGIGSDIHTTGLALSVAMAHNRTLLYHPTRTWLYTSPEECGQDTTPDCFLLPLSSCQYMADRLVSKGGKQYDFSDDPALWKSSQHVLLSFQMLRHAAVASLLPPPPANDRGSPQEGGPRTWRASESEDAAAWWQAMTARYLMRYRPSTTDWIKHHLQLHLTRYPPLPGWGVDRSPPPDRAVCVHVRHGDKAAEMRLHPLDDYIDAVVELPEGGNSSNRSTPSLRRGLGSAGAAKSGEEEGRVVFLVSDDEHVIAQVEEGRYDDRNLTFYFTRTPRRNDLTPQEAAVELGRAYFGRTTLADLAFAVHPSCRAFVLTTGSNFGMLINEIRRHDGVRRDAPVIDLEPPQ